MYKELLNKFKVGDKVVLDYFDYKEKRHSAYQGDAPVGVVVGFFDKGGCLEVIVDNGVKEPETWHVTRVDILDVVESPLIKALEEK